MELTVSSLVSDVRGIYQAEVLLCAQCDGPYNIILAVSKRHATSSLYSLGFKAFRDLGVAFSFYTAICFIKSDTRIKESVVNIVFLS